MTVLVKRYDDRATLPVRGTNGSAAVDLCVWSIKPDLDAGTLRTLQEGFWLMPGSTLFCGSGLAIDMTEHPNLCALILPRSGLGTKGLNLANTVGLIDNDYQGQLTMALVNRGAPIRIEPGMRVAQLMFMSFAAPAMEVVEEFPGQTGRGQRGYGSTGV